MSRDLYGECVEHGYFAGAKSGEDEGQVDQRFNQEYEIPFNRLLPIFDSDLHIFESREIKDIASKFVAHLFHRSKARRWGTEKLMDKMLANYKDITSDKKLLLQYAAKVSIMTQRSVPLEEVRIALKNTIASYSSDLGKQTHYVDDIDRATATLASELVEARWSVLRSNSSQELFISDTPVVSVGRDRFGTLKFGTGIRQTGAEWFLPISHARVIRISHSPRVDAYLSSSRIEELNAAQILTMSKKIYGKTPSEWVDQKVQLFAGIYKFHEDVFKTTADTSSIVEPSDWTDIAEV